MSRQRPVLAQRAPARLGPDSCGAVSAAETEDTRGALASRGAPPSVQRGVETPQHPNAPVRGSGSALTPVQVLLLYGARA